MSQTNELPRGILWSTFLDVFAQGIDHAYARWSRKDRALAVGEASSVC